MLSTVLQWTGQKHEQVQFSIYAMPFFKLGGSLFFWQCLPTIPFFALLVWEAKNATLRFLRKMPKIIAIWLNYFFFGKRVCKVYVYVYIHTNTKPISTQILLCSSFFLGGIVYYNALTPKPTPKKKKLHWSTWVKMHLYRSDLLELERMSLL